MRKEYREKIYEVPKFEEVARVLDEAFRRYILADHSPNVDLSSVFRDYLLSEDTEAVETGIREGKYNLTVR